MSKEQDPISGGIDQTYGLRLPDLKLPENYVIRAGFLCKGKVTATLVTSGLVEAAAQGFFRMDDAQEYETG